MTPEVLFSHITILADQEDIEIKERHINRILEYDDPEIFEVEEALKEVPNTECSHYLARESREKDLELDIIDENIRRLYETLQEKAEEREIELQEKHLDRAIEKIRKQKRKGSDSYYSSRKVAKETFGYPNTEELHSFTRELHNNDKTLENVKGTLYKLTSEAEKRDIELKEEHMERASLKAGSSSFIKDVFGTKNPEMTHYAHRKLKELKEKDEKEFKVDPMDNEWGFTESIFSQEDLVGKAYDAFESRISDPHRIEEEHIDQLLKELDRLEAENPDPISNSLYTNGEITNLEHHLENAVERTVEEFQDDLEEKHPTLRDAAKEEAESHAPIFERRPDPEDE